MNSWMGRALVTLAALAATTAACSGDTSSFGASASSSAVTQPPTTVDTTEPRLTTSMDPVVTTTVGPASTTATTAEGARIRLLSYNIRHGKGIDARIDLERTAEVIRSVSPDVVMLQEVDRETDRSGGVDQSAVLADLLGMDARFGQNIEFDGGGFGNALLSRFPILRSENVLLPVHNDGEQRGVLVAEIELSEEGQTVAVLTTHLDSRPDPTERLVAADVLNEMALESDGPAVLGGDLNATPESATLTLLAEVWAPIEEAGLHTFPSDSPIKQIDYILVSPSEAWQVVELLGLEDDIASDHRAVFAILERIEE